MDTATRETWRVVPDGSLAHICYQSDYEPVADDLTPSVAERIVRAHNSGVMDLDMAALRALLTRLESMLVIQRGKLSRLNGDVIRDRADGRIINRDTAFSQAVLMGEISALHDVVASLREAGVA